jgi:arylsulfatase A-like enzyme
LLLSLAVLSGPGCRDAGQGAASEREVYTVVTREFDWQRMPDASGLGIERVSRNAVSSDGLAIASPGRVSFTLNARAGDRLRLRFVRASPGDGTAPSLALTDASGRLDSGAMPWRVRDDWQEVELDLSPLAGVEARLELAVGPGSGEILVGQVLHLRRASVAHPNVILYVEDALRADRLGVYGYEQATDPHLRRLAGQGVRFLHGYAAANWTRPSVSTLLTGLDAAGHGNTADGGRIPEAAITLAQVYADAGYVTAAFVTNIHAGVWSGLERGFDLHYDMKAFPRSSRDSSLTSALINEPLTAFLEQHRDELLFVYVHSTDPHGPYRSTSDDLFAVLDAGAPRRVPEHVPEARVEQWSDWTLNYDGEIHHNDRSLARLDESLEALGLMRDTLFVFTSDHGEAFAEHGSWGHRVTLYQEEVSVPWILRWPAVLAAGRVAVQPAAHLDLPPTLLALAGIERPADWTGRDLSALCRAAPGQPAPAEAPRPMLIWGWTPTGPAVACVLPPWKLVAVPGADGEPLPVSLYNLAEDPGELSDRLREPELRSIVEALLDPVRDFMERHARHARAAGGASDVDGLSGLDEDDLDWLREMGYLR